MYRIASTLICLVLVWCFVPLPAVAAAPSNPLFLSAVLYDSRGNTPQSIASGDLDGDGKLDVVVGHFDAITVLIGKGDRTLSPGARYAIGAAAASIAIGDFNRDGIPDLVVAHCGNSGGDGCETGGFVDVWLGKGDGTFQVPTQKYNSGGIAAMSVAVGDLSNDGKLDLVVVNNNVQDDPAGSVGVLLGNGDGTFQAATAYASGGPGGTSIAVTDLNHDGQLDVVASNVCADIEDCKGGIVGTLLGNGDGTLQPVVVYQSGGLSTTWLAAADLNGDGNNDVVTYSFCNTDCTSGGVGVLLGNGDGTFQPPTTYGSGAPAGFGGSVAAADVNGDGVLDLVDANGDPPTIGVFIGNGDGTFQLPTLYPTKGSNPLAPVLLIGDLNRDRLLDVVVTQCDITGCGSSSFASVLLHVGIVKTVTSLSSSPNPSGYGKLTTFTAEVQSASGVPTGSVKFFDSSTELGSALLQSGTATFSTGSLKAGLRRITAVYQGSLRFQSSESPVLTQSVYKASTSITLNSSFNPAFVRQAIAYTAEVSGKFGGATTGSVVFSVDGVTTRIAPLQGNKATWNTQFTSTGTRLVSAKYLGDANNIASTTITLSQSVVQRTEMTLSSSPNPSFVRQPVQFVATLKSFVGQIPDGEIITFSDGPKIYGTAPLIGGTASLTITSIPAGSSFVRASYAGSQTFSANFASVNQIVQRYVTSTTIVSDVNPSVVGQPVTFTATVTASSSSTPSGWVTFKDGAKTISTGKLSGGSAKFTTSALSAGTQSITASYSVTPMWAPSASTALNQIVE